LKYLKIYEEFKIGQNSGSYIVMVSEGDKKYFINSAGQLTYFDINQLDDVVNFTTDSNIMPYSPNKPMVFIYKKQANEYIEHIKKHNLTTYRTTYKIIDIDKYQFDPEVVLENKKFKKPDFTRRIDMINSINYKDYQFKVKSIEFKEPDNLIEYNNILVNIEMVLPIHDGEGVGYSYFYSAYKNKKWTKFKYIYHQGYVIPKEIKNQIIDILNNDVEFNPEVVLENFESGIFKSVVDSKEMIFNLDIKYKECTEINLIYNDKIWDNLSVTTPDSVKLSKNEFYLNPEINKNIVKELREQGFITKTGKKTLAGDKETESYSLNI
jgi:hypothetical protein